MFLQYSRPTKKVAEEKLVGWGVLRKNKLIINLLIFLSKSQIILSTSWSVKGESCLVQVKILQELYLEYRK